MFLKRLASTNDSKDAPHIMSDVLFTLENSYWMKELRAPNSLSNLLNISKVENGRVGLSYQVFLILKTEDSEDLPQSVFELV